MMQTTPNAAALERTTMPVKPMTARTNQLPK